MASTRESQGSSSRASEPQPAAAPVHTVTDLSEANTDPQAAGACHSRARATSIFAPGFIKGDDGYVVIVDKGEELRGPGPANTRNCLRSLRTAFVEWFSIPAAMIINTPSAVRNLITKSYEYAFGRRDVPVQPDHVGVQPDHVGVQPELLRKARGVRHERCSIGPTLPTLVEESEISPLLLAADT